MYLDLNNVPFYIGKGKDDRCLIIHHLQKGNTNNLLKNKIRKVGVSNIKIYFLHTNLAEKEAFHWERYWIKYIGRRDLKKGSLCNLTDGGEIGPIGFKHSNESKRKISEAMSGEKHPTYGKHWPEETRRKMSLAKKGKPAHNKGKAVATSTKRKISVALSGEKHPMYGKHLSDITKLKISVAKKGKSTALKGSKQSEEHKKAISEAKRRKRER